MLVAEKRWRLDAFRQATGEPLLTAIAYLEAEEWDLEDALISYRGDQAAAEGAGACAFVGADTESAGACAFAGRAGA